MNRKIVLFPLAMAAILGLAGCSKENKQPSSIESTQTPSSEVKKASITVDKTTVELQVGEQTLVTATVTNADNGNKTWTSSNKEVATVAAGTITGVKEGTATITVSLDSDPTVKAEIAVTVTKKANPVTDTTVDKLADVNGGLSVKTLYRATGIIENLDHTDAFGNAYLTDPVSKKTVQIYGMTGTNDDSYFDYGASSDSKFFKNPKDATESLKNVENGQLVTVRVGWCKFGNATEIFGILEKAETATSKYAVNIASFEHGTAATDKTEYAYGEKVTLTVDPKTGYAVNTVEVTNTQKASNAVTKVEDNKYSFNATCVNNVTITLKDANDTKITVIWDMTKDSAPAASATTDTEFEATVGTLGKKKFGGTYVQQNTGYLMLYGKQGDSYLYSKEALPGSLVSVSITINGGSVSPNATYAVHFGTEALAKINKEGAVKLGANEKHEFTCDVENAKYFQLSMGAKYNGQVVKATIVYDTAK